MWSKKIKQLAAQEIDGLLPSILFPHAVAYVDNNGSLLCWQCANSDKEESVFDVVDYELDDTDYLAHIPTICDSCGKSIDPAWR